MRAALFLAMLAACGHQRLTKATSSIYVRGDSDATTVVTPSASVAADVARDTNLEVGYEVDAWTGASVDIITAATHAISEVRNEVDASVTHDHGNARAHAAFRYSTETDYVSYGGVLGARFELAKKNTTLELSALGSLDTVGRAGDAMFEKPQQTFGGRAAIAQVIDRDTIIDVSFEATRIDGFQASPYRWVAIGGDGTCASTAPFCVPERVPDERLRGAVFVRGRRALGRWWSAGLEYRFYGDDWDLRSHAIAGDLAYRPDRDSVVSLRYRYYTQGEAVFYRPRYATLDSMFATRDRKLSTFFSNEILASALQRIELDDDGDRVIVAGLRAGVSQIDYLEFVGLDRVFALEVTAMLGLELP